MGSRRLAQFSTSEEENEALPRHHQQPQQQSSASEDNLSKPRRRKRMRLIDEDEEEEEEDTNGKKHKDSKEKQEEGSPSGGEDEEEEPEARPIGDIVRVSGKGRGKRNHYNAFEYDGLQFELEDSVLLGPGDQCQKPYVAIIKDITQTKDGSVMVTGQWFYRPEEAQKKGGGNWQPSDTRELFYSFHRDEVPAESVMHKCVVHFVPRHKQLPKRKEHPGFIVQKVYDTLECRLFKLTDEDYEVHMQHEIDLLVQKTLSRLGDLPDIETEGASADQEDHLKTKKHLGRKNNPPLDEPMEVNFKTKLPDQHPKAETPGSCTANATEYYGILVNFNVLTGDSHRDKCLEKLLQGIRYMCNSDQALQRDDKAKETSGVSMDEGDKKTIQTASKRQEKRQKGQKSSFIWPDDVVPAVVALEKASFEALSIDHQKYNQKIRKLVFNLGKHALLARRLLNGELEPSKILNMSPDELKEGLTEEEMKKNKPDESVPMQMTDARCTRCNNLKVGLRDIIQAGNRNRYELECTACGHSWYASNDEASVLTISSKSEETSSQATPMRENGSVEIHKSRLK